jgi:hypothetical protein
MPDKPYREGPRWIVNEYGQQRWMWWRARAGLWYCELFEAAPRDVAVRWQYIGAAIALETPAPSEE